MVGRPVAAAGGLRRRLREWAAAARAWGTAKLIRATTLTSCLYGAMLSCTGTAPTRLSTEAQFWKTTARNLNGEKIWAARRKRKGK